MAAQADEGKSTTRLEVVELLLEEESGHRRRKELGHASSGRVSTMSSAESIVHVQVEGGSQLLGEVLVVLLLLGVEANVLEQAGLTILKPEECFRVGFKRDRK